MNNPFSNRSTTTSGEYLQKKKAITKIEYIKRMPWRSFKTRDYIVKGHTKKIKHYEKPNILRSRLFLHPPFPIPSNSTIYFTTTMMKIMLNTANMT